MDSYILSIPTRHTETLLPMLRALGCQIVEVRLDETSTALERLHRAACEMFGVSSEMVRSKTRQAECFRVRAIVMLIAHHDHGMTYLDIGRFYGRDHSTAMSAVNRISNDMLQESELRHKVESLRAQTTGQEPDLFRTNGTV